MNAPFTTRILYHLKSLYIARLGRASRRLVLLVAFTIMGSQHVTAACIES